MTTVFLVCAIVGGTLLVCQFVLTLIGLGGAHGDMDFHMPHDVGGELGHSHGGDVDHGDGEYHGSSWLFGVISFRRSTGYRPTVHASDLGRACPHQGLFGP